MFKKEKGFTLVELLVILVILTIIAIITIPIVRNIINESEDKANVSSSYGVVKAADFLYASGFSNKEVREKFDGNTNILSSLELDGKEPDDGEVYINKEGKIAIALKYGNRCYKKDYDDKEVTSLEYTEDNCIIGQLPNGVILVVDDDYGFWSDEPDDYNSFLDMGIGRYEVRKIKVVNHLNIPNGYEVYDVSENGDGQVMAWYNLNDPHYSDNCDCDLYDVYIGGIHGVQGNYSTKYLFSRLDNLEEIDLKYFYTNNVINADGMFHGTEKLTRLDLSNFNTANVTSMYLMFAGMSNLTNLDFRKATFNNVEESYSMFCAVPESLNIIAKDSNAEGWLRSADNWYCPPV